MPEDNFRELMLAYMEEFQKRIATAEGDWTVKGFIDVYQRIYTLSLDTKVLSKVLELLLLPIIMRFAEDHNYEVILARAQNQYPDISLVSQVDQSSRYAIDIKSTYRTSLDSNGKMRVSGMTLGTFGGYFRQREKLLSITFPYNSYTRHYVLGVIYTRVPDVQEQEVYSLEDLSSIPSVARDFRLFFHEKYRIASDIPGSGNTKNIGSVRLEERLVAGAGVFSKLGIEVFDDYWMHYMNAQMARDAGFDKPPYTNLKEYWLYKARTNKILGLTLDDIESDISSDQDLDK